MGAHKDEGDLARNESFLTEARRLLKNGRPRPALNMMDRFSDDRYARQMEEYWQVRAIALFMNGKFDNAHEALFESGGLNRKFLDEFIEAIEALALRRPTRLWWRVEKAQLILRCAVYEALEMTDRLGVDQETRRRLSVVLPSLATE